MMDAPGTQLRAACLAGAHTPVLAAWRSLLEAYAEISGRLDAHHDARGSMAPGDLEVLVQLASSPEHRLRMTELAERSLVTPSGLTRRVDRLEALGLVERRSCRSDRRGAWATLTDAGVAVVREALPQHQAIVEDHVRSRLSAADATQLAVLLARLAGDDAGPDAVRSAGVLQAGRDAAHGEMHEPQQLGTTGVVVRQRPESSEEPHLELRERVDVGVP